MTKLHTHTVVNNTLHYTELITNTIATASPTAMLQVLVLVLVFPGMSQRISVCFPAVADRRADRRDSRPRHFPRSDFTLEASKKMNYYAEDLCYLPIGENTYKFATFLVLNTDFTFFALLTIHTSY